MLVSDSVGWLPHISIQTLDASGWLANVNWYQSPMCLSDHGPWGSSRCWSNWKHSLKVETSSLPCIRSDSLSHLILVTALGAIIASLTAGEKSTKVTPSLGHARNWCLAETVALLQNWSSAQAAQLFVNKIPILSVDPNSGVCWPEWWCTVDRNEVRVSRDLLQL